VYYCNLNGQVKTTRMTIDIDDKLLADAIALMPARTKRDDVETALR
jgi:Arc/MetJ family transcription regulator